MASGTILLEEVFFELAARSSFGQKEFWTIDAAGSTETGCDLDGLTVLFYASDGACST